MDEPSDHAREIIARYRQARVLDVRARSRVRARLLASIAGAGVGASPRSLPTRRPSVLAIAMLAMATAAAVILVARYAWGPSHATVQQPHGGDTALFGQRAAQQARPTQARPAEPPPTPSAAPSADPAPPNPAPEPATRGVDARIEPMLDPPIDDGVDPALAAELRLVRAAQRALERGDTVAALQRLDAHAREFADGQLAEERQALRVEALCAAGKRPQARAEATLFARHYPNSTHARRVATACPPSP
jgi:hypothetical protein